MHFQVFIQVYDTNLDRRVMKIVYWEIINPRILNNDKQETCGRQGGLSVVQYDELWIERSEFEV